MGTLQCLISIKRTVDSISHKTDIYGVRVCLPTKEGAVLLKAAQLHNTLNVSFKVTMGNVTSSLSNLFLLNYAPLWQIICRLYARWIEFSVSESSLVNITNSSQGYLLIPDGTRCALCIFLPICGAYFFPRKENALIFYTFFLFLCQYMRVS